MNTRLERLEAVQQIVLDINKISASGSDLVEFITIVHQKIGRVMYAANFFVALFDASKNTIRFVYDVDERDPPLDPEQEFPLASPNESPTSWVIFHRQPLIMTAEEDATHLHGDKVWGTGTRAEHWMGYPLFDHQRDVIGVMVVQSYDKKHLFTQGDQKLFGLIAAHVSSALHSAISVDRLEQAVRERTFMLEHEVEERKKAETLQRVLLQIAELFITVAPNDKKFEQLQGIISQLVQVRNFLVALFHPESQEFSIEYIVDEKDLNAFSGMRFPMGAGISSYVMQQKQALLINRNELLQLIDTGKIKVLGNLDTYSWVGAPLMVDSTVYGVIVIQSYDTSLTYTEADRNLLAFVANHVASAFARMKVDEEIRIAKAALEQQNMMLSHTLDALKKAQAELVNQEKLASLGRLVAGIAHEINTPLGICVTATSHMVEELSLMRKEFAQGKLNEQGLLEFFDIFQQSLRIMTTNAQRGAALVRSFKQVAVDQSSEDIRQFDLRIYLDEVLLSLQPKLKGKNYTVTLNCPVGIDMKTYPGAISQILTNMLTNSLIHGFEGREKGQIFITAHQENDVVEMTYADDGIGVDAEAMEKLFEPFFTTKRGQGGSGLGTHISYNLVTGALAGQLKVSSPPGCGLTYQMRFPRVRK
ncbi:GAF domain-containing sensor histidine kinase [Undibacterium sp. SXout7W]|uniref:GAF domain-containing sensor histidine kinase n=1 Tax=Undibacterium sp. SXout7W TaxID=3413049 RepID=UPI003BF27881